MQVGVDPTADGEEEEEELSFTVLAGMYLARSAINVRSVIIPAQQESVENDYPFKALTVVKVNNSKTRMVLFGNGDKAIRLEERAGISTSWFNNNSHIALSTLGYEKEYWLARWTDAGFTQFCWLSGFEAERINLPYANFFGVMPGKSGADLTIIGPEEIQQTPVTTRIVTGKQIGRAHV